MYVYLVEANLSYLFGCVLNSEDCSYHKYIPTVLWKAKFRVVYSTQYSCYQYCFRVRIFTNSVTHTRKHVNNHLIIKSDSDTE